MSGKFLKSLLAVFACLLIFCACGRDNRPETIGEINKYTLEDLNKDIATAGDAQANSKSESSSLSGKEIDEMQKLTPSPEPEDEKQHYFRCGTWVELRGYVLCRYWTFFEDGRIRCLLAEDGATFFETEDGILPEEIENADLEQMDEDSFIISYQDGTKTEFKWISDKTDKFKFHTDKEILKALKKASGCSKAEIYQWDYTSVSVELKVKDKKEYKVVDVVSVNRITGKYMSGTDAQYTLKWE